MKKTKGKQRGFLKAKRRGNPKIETEQIETKLKQIRKIKQENFMLKFHHDEISPR